MSVISGMHKHYPSDLAESEWALVETLIPLAKSGGRPRLHDMRAILDAIFYLQRTGCSWRMLPHDLPPWQTVYDYYNRWRRDGTWQSVCTLINREQTQAR
ncbi:MAG: transposase [Anaerolineae bacterium]